MNRPHYTCHIKAAFMAKYHGMQFEDELGRPAIYHYPVGFSIDPLDEDDFGEPVGWGGALYVRKESLGLLEPVADDLIKSTLGPATYGIFRRANCGSEYITVIQRNGHAFHWPEFEGK